MQYNRADRSKFSSEDRYEVKIENDDKKKSRRTKKDQQGRVFNCPCGKSYLSYPALYTHVKTKHQGRSGFLDLKMDKQMSGVSSKESSKSQNKSKKYLANLSKLLNSQFISQNLNTNYEQNTLNKISSFIKFLENEVEQKQEKIKKQSRSICEMMGDLLSQIKGKINNQALSYLQHFLFNLAQFVVMINYQNCNQSQFGIQAEDHLQNVRIKLKKIQCNELPNYFNQFILAKKPPHINQQNPISKISLVLSCKVLMQLGKWMQQVGYTRYSIKFNTPLKKEEC